VPQAPKHKRMTMIMMMMIIIIIMVVVAVLVMMMIIIIIIRNVKSKIIPQKQWQLEPYQNYSDNTRATYRESVKSRNYKKAILGTEHILRKVLTKSTKYI
jgi:flagellar basal body-associated protein FliL